MLFKKRCIHSIKRPYLRLWRKWTAQYNLRSAFPEKNQGHSPYIDTVPHPHPTWSPHPKKLWIWGVARVGSVVEVITACTNAQNIKEMFTFVAQNTRCLMFVSGSKKPTKTPIVTFTNEVVQPVRLHYAILNHSQVLNKLRSLNCMGQNVVNQRFQWHFSHETKRGPVVFEPEKKPDNTLVLGFVFLSQDSKKLMVRVLSRDRTLYALKFFDHYFNRKHLRVEQMDVYNRIFEASPGDQRMVEDTDLLFPEAKIKVKDIETLPKLMDQWEAANLSPQETLNNMFHYISEMDKLPVPEIERLPVRLYEEGLKAVNLTLTLHGILAFEHFHGNTDFRISNAIEKMTGGDLTGLF